MTASILVQPCGREFHFLYSPAIFQRKMVGGVLLVSYLLKLSFPSQARMEYFGITQFMDAEFEANFGWTEEDDALLAQSACVFDQSILSNDVSNWGLLPCFAAPEFPSHALGRKDEDLEDMGYPMKPVSPMVESPSMTIQESSATIGNPYLSPTSDSSFTSTKRVPKRTINGHFGKFFSCEDANHKRKKSRYEADHREKVALIRKVGACIRCKSRKVEVSIMRSSRTHSVV
jgi:hypothetical protein